MISAPVLKLKKLGNQTPKPMITEPVKLKKAMNQIEMILKKHDISGVIVLHTPGQCKFQMFLDPTYSALCVDGNDVSIVIDPGTPDGDQNKMLSETSQMLTTLSESAIFAGNQLLKGEMALKKRFEFIPSPEN